MTLEDLAKNLRQTHTNIHLATADTFYWSPSDKTVYYDSRDSTTEGLWALLHETGHALLGHTQYYSDIELVQMEVAAWEKAKELAKEADTVIDEDHAEDCIDSYRNWLHRRSLCPACHLSGVQIDNNHYTCIFCHKKWRITAERFCRPYRKIVA
ncbi:ImmA/IrrE family metallo-endopeptidase [Candidatus Saccharibacteria bacterium]|nr:ImmA/IrrE family metallo-endopeptidase [Candidatus Saccharibacteria bacterium]MCA9328310.1 ImmA/IrrE family metallo-endopeptidase [Candidatus Saccharibacteria bacterium]MCA9343279.1 ImmA/IrrE family metallo-endopeptidase [Candidatus Saccharibacteria bacterium]